jgi:hypothetical protein
MLDAFGKVRLGCREYFLTLGLGLSLNPILVSLVPKDASMLDTFGKVCYVTCDITRRMHPGGLCLFCDVAAKFCTAPCKLRFSR